MPGGQTGRRGGRGSEYWKGEQEGNGTTQGKSLQSPLLSPEIYIPPKWADQERDKRREVGGGGTKNMFGTRIKMPTVLTYEKKSKA